MHTNDDKNIQIDKCDLISNASELKAKVLYHNSKRFSKKKLVGVLNYNPEMALVAISLCLETSIPISMAGSLKYLDNKLPTR